MKDRKVRVIFRPEKKEIITSIKTSLKELIKKTGIKVNFPCGGKGICGKCKVKVRGRLSPLTSVEKKHLFGLEKDVRLACQVAVEGDVEVEIFPLSLISFPKILTDRINRKIKISPLIKKIYLSLPPPSLKDQIADLSRLERYLKNRGVAHPLADLGLVKKLPEVMREGGFKITAVLEKQRLLAVEKGDSRGKNFGVAFDVGTTTVVGTLIDLDTGEELATRALLNPQSSFGEDVVSRIDFLQSHPQGLKILQKRIIEAINQIIQSLKKEGEVKKENIYTATFAGNTVMQHLLLGVNPTNLALYPYVPVVKRSMELKATDLGIRINPQGSLYLFPNIAAFVGGDTIAVILATSLFDENSQKIRLAIDIGTNGEIVLAKGKKLVCASAAAGPAFEGARISQGMRAERGAIEKVRLEDGKIIIKVIGEGRARGICGSGLIDASSQLLKEKIIDSSGRLKPSSKAQEEWSSRIIRKNYHNGFLLVEKEKAQDGIPIVLTQKDLRELQLAKGAICSGIKILLAYLEIERDQVDEVLLAGAFGSYINPESAHLIGLIPTFPKAKVRSVGNAASLGAIMALLSEKDRKQAERISKGVDYVELASFPGFPDILSQAMRFGKQG
ncbi:MAG: ASKHA domain-containing protein [bacterium]